MPNSEPSRLQQRILDAATDLFSSMGYHGASTRDIARVAEVNETSIYRYYPCKRDLFLAFVATLVALKDFYPVLAGEHLSDEALERAACTCAELWLAALSGTPEATQSLFELVQA